MPRATLTVLPRSRPWTELLGPTMRAVDRPVRAALELSRQPIHRTVAVGAAGLSLVTAASVVAPLLDGQRPGGAFTAVLQALLLVVPSTVVIATYCRSRATPAAMFATVSVGLLTAGIASWCLLPAIGFLALVAHDVRSIDLVFQLAVPLLTALGVALQLERLIKVVDGRWRSWLLMRSATIVLAVVLALRLASTNIAGAQP